jgi:nucleotidyltransferase/DNA polymerase involved in DNA repair
MFKVPAGRSRPQQVPCCRTVSAQNGDKLTMATTTWRIDTNDSCSTNMNNINNSDDKFRIVLLFDLDCFYAQCERVRLGLKLDVSLALLQWNSVLAVTYPARTLYDIKRGDSWDAVHTKSKGACWAIHLQILEKHGVPARVAPQDRHEQEQPPQQQSSSSFLTNDSGLTPTATDVTPATTTTTTVNTEIVGDCDKDNGGSSSMEDVKDAYDRMYKLSPEEQIECQRQENGRQRRQDDGKACLERYRIASARIFGVVLESLTNRLGNHPTKKDLFVMERASIDEFYLDITEYCCCSRTASTIATTNDGGDDDDQLKTVRIGEPCLPGTMNRTYDDEYSSSSSPLLQVALDRACVVSHWIRQDVWTELGFTMSAGISTNKMMAKLAASYGKPNGQAVLHPRGFDHVMDETKISKVRNFGGKLGHQVIQALLNGNKDATMGQLRSFSLPFMQTAMERGEGGNGSMAQFLFEACRGIDREEVKETRGALVKSITSFKSFTATSNWNDIRTWVDLMAAEVVTRVQNDTARYARYPKTCTLSYKMDVTDPLSSLPVVRSRGHPKSFRLTYPSAAPVSSSSSSATPDTSITTSKSTVNKIKQSLVEQSMQQLTKYLFTLQQQNPRLQYGLRGVGLAASNFEARGAPPGGVPSIESFFARKQNKSPVTTLTASTSFTAAWPTGSTPPTDTDALFPDLDDASGSGRITDETAVVPQGGASTEETCRKKDYFGIPEQQPQQESYAATQTQSESQLIPINCHEDVGSMENKQNLHQGQQCTPSSHSSSSVLMGCDGHAATTRHGTFGSINIIAPSSSSSSCSSSTIDRDLELAKKLQATFDREEYVLSQASQRRPRSDSNSNKKIRRIDTFFSSRR